MAIAVLDDLVDGEPLPMACLAATSKNAAARNHARLCVSRADAFDLVRMRPCRLVLPWLPAMLRCGKAEAIKLPPGCAQARHDCPENRPASAEANHHQRPFLTAGMGVGRFIGVAVSLLASREGA